MNKTILIALLSVFSICRVSFGNDNPSENFLQASLLFLKAQNEEKSGDYSAALRDYQLTEKQLTEISSRSPDFQKPVVEYRIKKSKEGIDRLASEMKDPVKDSSKNQSIDQIINYQCFVIEANHKIPHDYTWISHHAGFDVMSAPVLRGNVNQKVCVKVTRQLPRSLMMGVNPIQSVEVGISIFLKGALNQDNVVLDGRAVIVDSDNLQTNADINSFSIVSRDIYFSKKVKIGESAWVDLDFPKRNSKYVTIRIVPTLER
jgi:hypothetical protein